MQLIINVPDEVKVQAEAVGLAPESYAERLVREDLAKTASASSIESIRAAVDELREFRKGNTLGGLSIVDLVREGRKY